MSDRSAITVAVPAKYRPIFTTTGAAIGLIAAFVVGPVVGWLLGLMGDAPGLLRLAAELPFAWAVPVLLIVGAIAGFLICQSWIEDAGTIEVAVEGLTVHTKDVDRFVSRDRIVQVVRSGKELVLLDDRGEIYRGGIEGELVPGLRMALEAHGYPSLIDGDPYEGTFTTWVDGDGRLTETVEELLRDRRRALADKRPGAAEAAQDKLRSLGVMVRDRDGHQQYRLADESPGVL
ncbi:hypothetical protein [Propionimicrobium sp. PCR01-08-3]|uniref:YqeB family protein n=1 Tax=Propionimicrobium sp. PCR01-08-3 TaxID=3052086 RepID=UPI00255CA6A3|nr:hypothetical protein [Propionimicrobium sp. PCR01-08-3]WIY83147.1 hypothetical protein QQ658_01940 [Propionimicrobium sp. PCR01-08-3]